MRNGTPPIAALSRSLTMLEAIFEDRDERSIASIARRIGMPVATAHRQVTTLVAEGYLIRPAGGPIGPGPRLLRLLDRIDDKQAMVSAAAPILNRLAVETGLIAQLGTLENDMVTYRIKTGRGAAGFFTKVGMQLEAYCSGIGKVLLAGLPEQDREAYLASGPFPALTKSTITQAQPLREELERAARQGFARDDEEVVEGLACVAVPIRKPDASISAAISLSRAIPGRKDWTEAALLEKLNSAAEEIRVAVFGQDAPARQDV